MNEPKQKKETAKILKIMWFILLAWGSASARLRTLIPARTDIRADLSSNMINLINLKAKHNEIEGTRRKKIGQKSRIIIIMKENGQ